jgi:hypothetical protein
MALALDGFKVLRRIGKHADRFGDIAAEVNKAAHALLLKQVKARKTAPLKSVRELADILGDGTFALFVDGMSDAEVTAILGKLDKNNPQLAERNPSERRNHLVALADGSAEPMRKPAKAKGRKTKKAAAEIAAAAEPPRLASAAMAAIRRRD